MGRIEQKNAVYCRNCEEYHFAQESEDPLQLVDDCESGNWK